MRNRRRLEDDKNKKFSMFCVTKRKIELNKMVYYNNLNNGFSENGSEGGYHYIKYNRGGSLDERYITTISTTSYSPIDYYLYYESLYTVLTESMDAYLIYNDDFLYNAIENYYNATYNYLKDNNIKYIDTFIESLKNNVGFYKAGNYIKKKLTNYTEKKLLNNFLQNLTINYYTILSEILKNDGSGEIISIWNEFVTKAKQNKTIVDTTGYYDADGKWHWTYSGYELKCTIRKNSGYVSIIESRKNIVNNKVADGSISSREYKNSEILSYILIHSFDLKLIPESE